MAFIVILLLLSACGPNREVGSDDYIEDGNGKRQLTQVEYDALIEFLASAGQRNASSTADAASSHVIIDGKSYLIYWTNLCPDDRTKAYHIRGIKFSRDHNYTLDLTDVLAWAEQHEE